MSSLPTRSERPAPLVRVPRGQRASLLGDLRIAFKSLVGALLQLTRSRRHPRRSR